MTITVPLKGRFLLRLMQYASLSPRVRLGPEDRLALEFASRLRAASLEGRLRAVWCHVPNELAGAARATVPAAIARALGLIAGTADYLFLSEKGGFALEAKSIGGRQTDGQRDFELWCASQSVPYAVFRTVDEGIGYLREWGLMQ